MGLTSKKVLLLAAVAAVVLFGATVWLWPRLSRSNVRAVLGRVAILLLTQLSLIAALGLAANYSFGFYASWADLFGQESDLGVVVDHSGDTAAKHLVILGEETVPVPGGASRRTGGLIQRVQFQGGATGITTPAFVYLPPEYFQHRYARRTFPAAVVLTGYPGTAAALVKKMRYPAIAHEAVRQGRMRPMVLVMMRPTVAPPRDTECMDIPAGPQTETFFTQDLRTAVSARYRVGGRAASWGIIGDSTGGYCALKLAMRHPEAFTAAAALSADYRAPHDSTTGDLFGGSARLEHENDLLWRLHNLPGPPTSLLVTSSRQGEKNYRATLRFIAGVKPPTHVSAIILASGGHNFTTWSREIPPALQWLSGRLSG